MRVQMGRYCALAIALVIGAANAQSPTAVESEGRESAIWNAVQTIAAHVSQAENHTPDSSELEQLAEFLAATGFDTTSENPIAEYSRVLLEASLSQEHLPAEQVISELSTRLPGFLFNRNGDDGLRMGMLLYPYMEEAGLCDRHASSAEGEGVICQFAFATPGANIAAVAEQGQVPLVDPSSALGQVLMAAMPGGSVGIAASGKSGYGEGTTQYSYLGVPISAWYAYYYAWQYNCGSSCRGSAGGWGAIKGTYAGVGADTVFAAAGAALYCGWNCILEAGWDYINGDDLLTSVLHRGDKRYDQIHEPAKAVHALVPACGTVPGSYAASPLHYMLENADYELPYDVGIDIEFGTYFQRPNESGTGPAMFPNLDPGPPTKTHYKVLSNQIGLTAPLVGNTGAKLAIVGYEYSFTELRSWFFDIIFAAANSATSSVPTTCYARVPASIFGMGNGYAFGDTMWFYQGFAKSGEDYDLPTISVGIGF